MNYDKKPMGKERRFVEKSVRASAKQEIKREMKNDDLYDNRDADGRSVSNIRQKDR